MSDVGSGVWFGLFALSLAAPAFAGYALRTAWPNADRGWRVSFILMLLISLLLPAFLLARGCYQLCEKSKSDERDANTAASFPKPSGVFGAVTELHAIVGKTRRDAPSVTEYQDRSDEPKDESDNVKRLHAFLPNVKDEPRRGLARAVRQHRS